MKEICSIILTHFAGNTFRSELMRRSIKSLLESLDFTSEIIVIDNGKSMPDSAFLFGLAESGKINTYIRNSDNMNFGYARNQGLAIANGRYLCIVDNDLIYRHGWLSECIKLLKLFSCKKIYTTPIDYPTVHLRKKWDVGTLEYDGKTYRMNTRAGSNCFVILREDFQKIGRFFNHRLAGSLWATTAAKLCYSALIIPNELVKDEGLRKGFNLKISRPICEKLSDDSMVYFNNDSFRKINKGKLDFINQGSF